MLFATTAPARSSPSGTTLTLRFDRTGSPIAATICPRMRSAAQGSVRWIAVFHDGYEARSTSLVSTSPHSGTEKLEP
jgi:hypothetical protein